MVYCLMNMELIKDIDNLNDRRNLMLLHFKFNKTQKEKNRLIRLQNLYPDNDMFWNVIYGDLFKCGMIGTTNIDGYDDECGNYVYKYPELPKENYTTEIGGKALKNNLFPSELRQKSLDKRFRYLQAVGIAIAAIGGLITIINLFIK